MADKKSNDEGALAGTLFTAKLFVALVVGPALVFGADFGLTKGTTLYTIAHEIGFALMVAGIVWLLFEFFTQRELIGRISRNVFSAILKRDLPEELIEEARQLVLNQNFVRKELRVNYHLHDGTYTDRFEHKQAYVKLEIEVNYKILNVCHKAVDYPVKLTLPQPFINELKPLCKVQRIQVEFKDLDLSSAEAEFRKLIEDDDILEVPFSVCELRIKPGEEKHIFIHYYLAKRVEDLEIVQMGYPAAGIDIHINDHTHPPRLVEADSLHPEKLNKIAGKLGDGPPYIYKLERYLLPHQGVKIWWNNDPRVKPVEG